MRWIHGLLACVSLFTASMASAEEIFVSAAASLRDAVNVVAARFESNTQVKVNFNFAASGVLQKQIESGAPVDVFVSAGVKQMDELDAKGLIVKDTRRDLVKNDLVVVVPLDSKLSLQTFADLTGPQVKRVAIGNPKTVPAGQYSQQVLEHFKLEEQIQSRLVFAEDVRQVLDYVLRGEVEAGLVYASDAKIVSKKVLVALRAPMESHKPIVYPIAVVQDSRHAKPAQKFIEFALGEEGQYVFKQYGFLPASTK